MSEKKKRAKKTLKTGSVEGRPRLIDDEKFDLIGKLCRFKLKLTDVAELAGVSQTTLEDEIKMRTGITFREFRDQKMATVRQSLAQKAITMAMNGNVSMLIFSLKNMNGWSDEPADDGDYEESTLEFI